MTNITLHDFSWERMLAAVEDVRDRARRSTAALRAEGIPHMVIGGHAVASWVARVDAEAVRNTKDVDVLLRRADFDRAVEALRSAGFVHQKVAGVDLFLDGPAGSVRSAVHVVFADERTRPEHLVAAPAVTECEPGPEFAVATLEALVRMKLTAFRLKDQLHLIDLIAVGLVDESWLERVPSELVVRLRQSLDAADREG